MFNKNKNSLGYSMLELLLATAVGAIVIAGGYTSYSVIAKQYQRISAFSEVQSAGMPTLRLIARDLRMAGRVALDGNLDPVYSAIAAPITITDSGNACCDSIVIIYDKESTANPKRCQITYSVNTTTNILYMDVSTLQGDTGDTCTGDGSSSIVTKFVEDLQFEGSDNDSFGYPRIVDMELTLRSQSKLNKTISYTKPDNMIGNYNLTASDNYHRDEFTATVNVKNLRD